MQRFCYVRERSYPSILDFSGPPGYVGVSAPLVSFEAEAERRGMAAQPLRPGEGLRLDG